MINKEDIVTIIESHGDKASVFGARFSKVDELKYQWVMPAVDTFNIEINIKDDNLVEHVTMDYSGENKIFLTYYELINKYNLNTK